MGRSLSDLNVRLGLDKRDFTRGIEQTKTQLNKFNKSILSISRTFTGLGAGFAIGGIASMLMESTKLAAQITGVRTAFEKLNKPGLLDTLRKATRNTVTDLELMKSAVKANNFQVPLSKLGQFFEFATKRSIETGESVDFLVESIVNGIGRKSSLVLDNLGISATELQREIKKTGDFGEAAGNIIQRSLEKTGDVADTAAVKLAQINTELKNVETGFWEEFLNIFTAVSRTQEEAIKKQQKFNLAVKTLGKDVKVTTESYKEWAKVMDDVIKEFDEFLAKSKLLKSGQRLRAEIEEMTKALGTQVSQSSLTAASHGHVSNEVEKLRGEYEKYLERLDTGISIVEQYIEANKAAFKVYSRTTDKLKEQTAAAERLEEVIRKIVLAAKGDFSLDELSGANSKNAEAEINAISESLLNQAEDADVAYAELFDSLQRKIDNINWNNLKRPLEELNRKVQVLSASYSKFSGVVGQAMNNSKIRLNNTIVGLEKEKEAVNQRFDAERSRLAESTTNAKLRSDSISRNEKERKSALLAIENKIAEKQQEFAVKQAKISKATGVTESIINTAVGVTSALSTGNIPLAAIIGGLGAAQTALIAAQPIPQFATGGFFGGGMAMVGERGAELIQTSGPTKVFNNRQTGNILANNNMNLKVEIDGSRAWLFLEREAAKLANRR